MNIPWNIVSPTKHYYGFEYYYVVRMAQQTTKLYGSLDVSFFQLAHFA